MNRTVTAAALLFLAGLARADEDSIQSVMKDMDAVIGSTTAALAPRSSMWLSRTYGPYVLVTHDASLYPSEPTLLIREEDAKKDAAALKKRVAKRLKTKAFESAKVRTAQEFFDSLLKEHPEKKDIIQKEAAKLGKHLYKEKRRAVALRLGTCVQGGGTEECTTPEQIPPGK